MSERDPLENDPDISIPQLDLDDNGIEQGVQRLAAAVILDAIQEEKSGRGDQRNQDFLAGHGYFNHWAKCLGIESSVMRGKVGKALNGFTRSPRIDF